MNKFELFTMIFYALDAQWNKNKRRDLGDFLSSMNPFWWGDIGSADPAIYADFCSLISEPVTRENSFDLAGRWIDCVGEAFVKAAFSTISRDVWNECLDEYLSAPHKGADS